jgi:uncharacterized membrane protein YtjA (UPF0391 family)
MKIALRAGRFARPPRELCLLITLETRAAVERCDSLLRRRKMLRWAVIFLIIALVAALFGFTGIAAAAAGIAKFLFFLFLVFCLIFFVIGISAGRRVP